MSTYKQRHANIHLKFQHARQIKSTCQHTTCQIKILCQQLHVNMHCFPNMHMHVKEKSHVNMRPLFLMSCGITNLIDSEVK